MARAICLRALTGTPKTRRQLAELLAARGVPDDAATAVLDRFSEVGLIDDAAFARAWVTSRQAGRGLARRALRAELHAKGVAAEVAAEALELVHDEDERAAARALVERRLPGMRRLDRATATRRLLGLLARRGYGGGLAAAVVREALDLRGGNDFEGDDFEGDDFEGDDFEGDDFERDDFERDDFERDDFEGGDGDRARWGPAAAGSADGTDPLAAGRDQLLPGT